MKQVIFIEDTRKGRVYAFATKDEERKFRLFWMMGRITDPYSQSNKPLSK